MNKTNTFDLANWKRRFDYNAAEAERNSYMDSGWSAGTAESCIRRAGMLWRELAVALADVDTKPEDYFDRPDLVAIQEAARYATRPAAAQGEEEGA